MELKVTKKNVYGNELIYPSCEKSKVFADLINKKTFHKNDMDKIVKLGYYFIFVM